MSINNSNYRLISDIVVKVFVFCFRIKLQGLNFFSVDSSNSYIFQILSWLFKELCAYKLAL